MPDSDGLRAWRLTQLRKDGAGNPPPKQANPPVQAEQSKYWNESLTEAERVAVLSAIRKKQAEKKWQTPDENDPRLIALRQQQAEAKSAAIQRGVDLRNYARLIGRAPTSAELDRWIQSGRPQ